MGTSECFIRRLTVDSLCCTPVSQIYSCWESASAQNVCDILISASIDLTDSTNVRFILSATPFCSGDLGIVHSCRMPSSGNCKIRQCIHLHYSFARFLTSRLWTFRSVLSIQDISQRPDFCVSKTYIQVCLVWLSINVRKYSAPLNDCVPIFPHTSLCTKSRTLSHRFPPLFGNVVLWCFPSTQGSQNPMFLDMS